MGIVDKYSLRSFLKKCYVSFSVKPDTFDTFQVLWIYVTKTEVLIICGILGSYLIHRDRRVLISHSYFCNISLVLFYFGRPEGMTHFDSFLQELRSFVFWCNSRFLFAVINGRILSYEKPCGKAKRYLKL